MIKDMHHKDMQVPVNFKTLKHRFLYWVIETWIKSDEEHAPVRGKFKEGDWVSWNWKAYVQLSTIAKPGKWRVSKVTQYSRGSDGIACHEGIADDDMELSGSAFWFKKVKAPKNLLQHYGSSSGRWQGKVIPQADLTLQVKDKISKPMNKIKKEMKKSGWVEGKNQYTKQNPDI